MIEETLGHPLNLGFGSFVPEILLILSKYANCDYKYRPRLLPDTYLDDSIR